MEFNGNAEYRGEIWILFNILKLKQIWRRIEIEKDLIGAYDYVLQASQIIL